MSPRARRVAYLTSEYPAISHTFIQREIEELRKRGVTVETFSVREPKDSGVITDVDRRERDDTFVLLRKPYRALLEGNLKAAVQDPVGYAKAARTAMKLRTEGPRGLLKWAGYLAEGVHLGRELKKRGIEHVHNHFANASANVALLAAEYADIPFSFTLHGLPELEWEGVGPLADKIDRAAFMSTICDFNRAQAFRMSGPEVWNKIFVARCGLDMSQFPRKPPGPRRQGPIRVLCVARLSKEKGIPGLLEAFAGALHDGLDAELILIGDGPLQSEVRREVARLGIDRRVDMRGRQAGDQVRAAFADADIFALPSLMEGLPIVLMESMAIGTPVIAPALAGIPELVIDDDTGLLFAPANWDQLRERILRLGRDEDLRARLADAGRAKVEQQHDIARAVVPLEARLFQGGSGEGATS